MSCPHEHLQYTINNGCFRCADCDAVFPWTQEIEQRHQAWLEKLKAHKARREFLMDNDWLAPSSPRE
jgi:hypothetical protein